MRACMHACVSTCVCTCVRVCVFTNIRLPRARTRGQTQHFLRRHSNVGTNACARVCATITGGGIQDSVSSNARATPSLHVVWRGRAVRGQHQYPRTHVRSFCLSVCHTRVRSFCLSVCLSVRPSVRLFVRPDTHTHPHAHIHTHARTHFNKNASE